MSANNSNMRFVKRGAAVSSGPAAESKVLTGYGQLVWWPFAAVIIILGLLSQDFVLSTVSIFWAIAMAWLGGRVPYIAFACFYQALTSLSGAAYLGVYGRYPGGAADVGLVPSAAVNLLVSLLITTATYYLFARKDSPGDARIGESARILKLSPKQLAILIFILYSPEWLRIPLQTSSTGGFRQIVLHLVNFRLVFYGIFFINSLRSAKKSNYLWLIAMSLYIAMPLAVTGSSGWAGVAILALCFAAGSLVFPIARGGARLNPVVVSFAAIAIIFIAGFGLIWEGGLKLAWRTSLRSGSETAAATNFGAFARSADDVMKNFRLDDSLEALTSRMSSGLGFSSLVMRNVPRSIPYEKGGRIFAALQNLVPRILYSQKAELGSDSLLVQKYAQVNAAGEEQQTSIGLGYVAEFYIDFGLLGIAIGSAIMGSFLGLGALLFRRLVGPGDLGNLSIAVILLCFFLSADASLAKLWGSMFFAVIMFALFVFLTNRYMYENYEPEVHDQGATRRPASRFRKK